jgi:hypothetical protein
MTIGELVFWYSSLFLAFLVALIVELLRHKSAGKRFFTHPDWHWLLGSLKRFHGEFWLKVGLAVFIALSAGVIIALFILPYG